MYIYSDLHYTSLRKRNRIIVACVKMGIGDCTVKKTAIIQFFIIGSVPVL